MITTKANKKVTKQEQKETEHLVTFLKQEITKECEERGIISWSHCGMDLDDPSDLVKILCMVSSHPAVDKPVAPASAGQELGEGPANRLEVIWWEAATDCISYSERNRAGWQAVADYVRQLVERKGK